MSFTSSHSTEHGRLSKPRIQRRHGACEPCRSSKTKCDGRMPCGSCRSERRRQCPCIYSEKVMKLQQVTAEMRRRAERDRAVPEPAIQHASTPRANAERASGLASIDHTSQDPTRTNKSEATQDHIAVTDKDEQADPASSQTFMPLSLCGAVDEFKNLKPTRGGAAQVVSRCNGLETVDVSTSTSSVPLKSRKAVDLRPQIPEVHTSIDEISSLKDRLDTVWISVTQGRLRRAWVDLASLVREAELFETSDASAQISGKEQNSWKQLWTNILDLESQLGLALGRPTSLVLPKSANGKLIMDATVPKETDLDATRLDLFQHIQAILSLDSRSPTVSSDFHDKARAILSYEPFHKVGLCTTEDHSASARDLQLNTHLLFMVIYCRLASMCDVHAREGKAPIFLGTESTDNTRPLNLNQPRQKLTYCRMMFRSAKFVVSVFLSLVADGSDIVGQNWTRCHSAFIAATLLGIAKLRHEVEWDSTTELLRKLEQAFTKLSRKSIDCNLFTTAINRLRDLNSVKEPASEITRNKHSGIKHRKRHATSSVETSPINHNVHDQMSLDDAEGHIASPSRPLKRSRAQMEVSSIPNQDLATSFNSGITETGDTQPMTSSSTSFDASMDQIEYYADDQGLFSQSNSFMSMAPSSAATSFCESETGLAAMSDITVAHPGPPFAYPFPYEIVHPPMMLYNPTMLAGDQMLIQTPMGVQYFQATTSLESGHAALAQMNPISPTQEMDGTATSNSRTSMGTASTRPFQNTREQNHLAETTMTPKSAQLLSPISTMTAEHPSRFGLNRRHSTETINLDSNAVQTPVLHQWQTPHANVAAGEAHHNNRRATSVDDAERAAMRNTEPQQQIISPQPTTFFVPMTRPLSMATNAMPQPMYHHAPTSGVEVPGGQYYRPTMTPNTDLGQFRQNYPFACHQQQEYIHGQEQWRQMSVNAGVPGGP